MNYKQKFQKADYLVQPYNLALIYNVLGKNDQILDYWEKSFAEKDVLIFWLKVEPK